MLFKVGLESVYSIIKQDKIDVGLGLNIGYMRVLQERYYQQVNTNYSYGKNYLHIGPIAQQKWNFTPCIGLMLSANPTFMINHLRSELLDAIPPSNYFANYLQLGLSYKLGKLL